MAILLNEFWYSTYRNFIRIGSSIVVPIILSRRVPTYNYSSYFIRKVSYIIILFASSKRVPLNKFEACGTRGVLRWHDRKTSRLKHYVVRPFPKEGSNGLILVLEICWSCETVPLYALDGFCFCETFGLKAFLPKLL